MLKADRKLLLILSGIALVCTVSVLSAWAYVRHSGMVVVHVQERNGDDVRLSVPGVLVQAGLVFAPWDEIEHGSIRSAKQRRILRAVLKELSSMPDADLVTVEGLDERVRIAKKGRTVTIDVLDDEDMVHVTVPLGVIRQIAKRI